MGRCSCRCRVSSCTFVILAFTDSPTQAQHKRAARPHTNGPGSGVEWQLTAIALAPPPPQGFYLPFVFVAFSVLVGGNWVADIFGILAGHL